MMNRKTDMLTVMTYNTMNLLQNGSPEEEQRFDQFAELCRTLIHEHNVDVLAYQELKGADEATMARNARLFADAVDMDTIVDGALQPAVAYADTGFHPGVMWRHGIRPVDFLARGRARADLWHALAAVDLNIKGITVRVVSYHACPNAPDRRVIDAYTATRFVQKGGVPTLVAMDANNIGTDQLHSGDYFDPEPFTRDATPGPSGLYIRDFYRPYLADRRAAQVFQQAGLHDTAVLAGADWTPTVGHFREDSIPRDFDKILATGHFVPAVRSSVVVDDARTRAASDHLPKIVTVDLSALVG